VRYGTRRTQLGPFAAANYPYAAPMPLSLQIAKLLVARALTFLVVSPAKSPKH
jgi:hypothetical protein